MRALPARAKLPPVVADAAIAATLALLQALLVLPLFAGPFTKWRGSIEAAFITDARFIVEHFPDLSWNPLWYLGFPFELFYTPLLPGLVALLGWLSGDVPSAYRLVAASGFALGAAGLYTLARALGLSRAAAILAAALFACAPSASLLMPGFFTDAAGTVGSFLPLPWHLVVLVKYGEGPHVLGLSLALFATAALLRYLERGGAARFWLATALLLAVALTNLIAVLGAAVLAAGCVLALPGGRERLLRGARVAGATGILALAWYSPGFVRAVGGFSTPGGEGGGATYLLFPAFVVAAALGARLLGRLSATAAILVFWTATLAAILVAWQLWRAPLAPQPIRYAIELDAVVAIAIAALLATLIERAVRGTAERTLATVAIVAVVVVISLPGWLAVRERIAPDPNWRTWSEREVALWLRDRLGPGERAYLSGSHAFWADVFADVPQVRGGVDFAGTTPWWAHASYQINQGSDPATSVAWLRALGVRYAVVSGPESTDAFRDFVKPEMFEGVLPQAATIQGARIYELSAVIATPRLVARDALGPEPRHGLDREAVEAYVRALDAGLKDGRLELAPRGLAGWEGTVDSSNGGTILFRVAHDSGWRAHLDEKVVALRRDPIGLLALDVPPGAWRLRVDHRAHTDLLLGSATAFGFLALLAWRQAWRRRKLVARVAPVAAIVGLVVLYSIALGVVTGYPKGTDAPMHLARLKFVADWFPHHNWLYAWSAGMPMFDSYPALPYLAALPLVKAIGPEPTLELMALVAFWAIGLGLYGHLVARGRPREVALLAALMAITSLALWTWVVNGGVYTRVVAIGLGALAWWTHARALATERARWWAFTALLLAAAIASHQVMGAFAALYVAGVQLSGRGLAGLPRLAGLAVATFLLASPAIVPALAGGIGGRFLGTERGDLLASSPDVVWHPLHVGLAAFAVPVALVIAELTRRPLRALAAGTALLAAALYVFAPNLGIPSSLYYVRGVDPFSATFVLALVGALAFAAVVPTSGGRARAALAVASLAVAANVLVAVPTFAAHRDYPQVVDTTEPRWPEELARRTLVVDADDLRHRLLPLTAYESVWFSYAYRKPMLRDYYAQGQLHPDWLFWAYQAVYAPPLDAKRFAAVLDWFAIDAITTDGTAERELAAMPGLRLVPSTASAPFRQFEVANPSTIVVQTAAPLVVIVADARGYDLATRFLLEEGASPRTRVPVWWPGTVADLPDDLASVAAAVLVVGDRHGDRAGATATLERLTARSARVVWDVAGVEPRELPAPWPVVGLRAQLVSAWDVHDRADRIAAKDFSPARYGDGDWGAVVPAALRDGARAELVLAGAPLVASVDRGAGSLTVVGGNLFYHALAFRNAAERAYLASFLGPATVDAASEPEWRFAHPERREVVVTDATPVALKESFHPGWRAAWRGADGTARDLRIHPAGPGLMLVVPPAAGTIVFEYSGTLAHALGAALFVVGVLLLGLQGGLTTRRARPRARS